MQLYLYPAYPTGSRITETPEHYSPASKQRYRKGAHNFVCTIYHNFMAWFCLHNALHLGLKRKRCGECEACQMGDCGARKFCKDKTKFGGPNKLKQSCIKQRCLYRNTLQSGSSLGSDTIERVSTCEYCTVKPV